MPRDIPASVRERLGNIARERNVDFGPILVKYGLEGILYRLGRSAHREAFILKGALLFELCRVTDRAFDSQLFHEAHKPLH